VNVVKKHLVGGSLLAASLLLAGPAAAQHTGHGEPVPAQSGEHEGHEGHSEPAAAQDEHEGHGAAPGATSAEGSGTARVPLLDQGAHGVHAGPAAGT
jgi:hypothetical protein